MTTQEQRDAMTVLRLQIPAAWQVRRDDEGWPMVRGRYGRVEWHSSEAVAVYSQAMRKLHPLLGVPGVRRWQVGDDEYRLILPLASGDYSEALRGVGALIRVRTRRKSSEAQKLALSQGRARLTGQRSA